MVMISTAMISDYDCSQGEPNHSLPSFTLGVVENKEIKHELFRIRLRS